jgi:hypothetical protein
VTKKNRRAPLDVDLAVQTKVIETTSKIKHLSSSKSDKINNIFTIVWNGVGARLVVAIEERLKGNVFLDSKQNFKGNVFSKKNEGGAGTIHNSQPPTGVYVDSRGGKKLKENCLTTVASSTCCIPEPCLRRCYSDMRVSCMLMHTSTPRDQTLVKDSS